MKKLLSFLLVAVLAAAAALPAFADSTPAIFKVTDSEGRFIYLLGTCHILTPDCLPIAGIDELLDQCSAVALEIQLNENSLSTLQTEFMVKDSAGNSLSQETRDRIAAFFASRGIDTMEDLIPHMDASMLLLLVTAAVMMGSDPSQMVVPEMYLNDLALERGLTLIGLETASDQAQALNDGMLIYTDEEAELQLNEILASADLYTQYIAMLQQAWSTGDQNMLTLFSQMETVGSEKDEVTKDVIITERNDVFFDGIVGLFENGGGVFVAVGLAHVFDPENGLLVQLPAAGYTVERWFPAEEEALPPAA